ncbi:glycosyltransferase family 2 protein [Loktanella sp. S4079]|uniref:glycosyltransferase family 2 protein n=1 Tax=Loktanella sp. S4079 TaxID=579483 RepID=UPI0005FA05DB|nr:glycosyltransferase family 2 protein [Loktanella sp. S4079]KJZ17651.1 glucosyl transferase [Loktanella sp. S4079]
MTLVSIVVPAFNVSRTLAETLHGLFRQTFPQFEIIVVDDGSTDDTLEIARSFADDPRLRIIHQSNRGLAGARNTGIAEARGAFIGFCDSDDVWEREKLAAHVKHLQNNSDVGISFAGSRLITDDGKLMSTVQRPRLYNIDASHVLKRNPIGNGSTAVIRREVFEDIGYSPPHETVRDWYFDETFRQSEDIECWMRIMLTTSWRMEGVPGLLTRYRINGEGLSAGTESQLEAWEKMVDKLTPMAPELFAKHVGAARAYQLRYLCRRAVSSLDVKTASALASSWVRASWRPFIEEPRKSLTTYAAVLVLRMVGARTLEGLRVLRAGRA